MRNETLGALCRGFVVWLAIVAAETVHGTLFIFRRMYSSPQQLSIIGGRFAVVNFDRYF